MHFSVFDNDETLGFTDWATIGVAGGGVSLGSGRTQRGRVRQIVFQLVGRFRMSGLGWFTDEQGEIRDTLNGKGWNVSSVSSVGGSGIGNRTFNIYATVNDTFSDGQAATIMSRDLESKINIASVKIVNSSVASYVNVDASAGLSAVNGISGGTASGDFLSNLGLGLGGGLGLSSPVVLLGGAVLLLLVLKK